MKSITIPNKMQRNFRPVPKVIMGKGGKLVYATGGDTDPRTKYQWNDLGITDPNTSDTGLPDVEVTGTNNRRGMGIQSTIPQASTMPSATIDKTLPDSYGNLSPKGPSWLSRNMPHVNAGDIEKVLPFASNIVNSFRKVPSPIPPAMATAQAMQKITGDDENYQTSREINASNSAADKGLSANTASAVKLFNSGRKLDAFSRTNERVRNTNAAISNENAKEVTRVNEINTGRENEYHNQLVESKIAQQRAQSQNFANASDKAMTIKNEAEKRNVDIQKTKMGLSAFKDGIATRSIYNQENLGGKDADGNTITQQMIDSHKPIITPDPPKAPATATPSQTATTVPNQVQTTVPPLGKNGIWQPPLPKQFTTPMTIQPFQMRRKMGGAMRKVTSKC